MGAWDFVTDVFQPVAVGLLLIALGWAAYERGRIHHYLPRLPRISSIESIGKPPKSGSRPLTERLRRRT